MIIQIMRANDFVDNRRGLSFKAVVVLGCVLGLVLLFCAFKLRAYPNTEWDEGAYLTTFRTIQNGFPAYQQTYLSQPPGFFIAIYPLYRLLGASLEAARLAILFYSLLGLVAIIWLGWELNIVAFSFIAIGILYVIPIYYTQIMTFHADSLPSTFSTLALASIFRFRNCPKWRWLILSALFAAAAVLLKADVSVFPAIFLILLYTTRAKSKKIGYLVKSVSLFCFIFFILIVGLVLPFGLHEVFDDVVKLRLQAAAAFPYDPTALITNFEQQPQLEILLLSALLMSGIIALKYKETRFSLFVLIVWVLSTSILLLIYHPLMGHHLTLLAVPVALFFSFALFTLLNSTRLARFTNIATLAFLVVVLLGRLNYSLTEQVGIPSAPQIAGIDLVQAYTVAGDYIVSDDGLIIALANRPTPPNLVDLSYVRIKSGNLTADNYSHDLATYHPKMVLAWDDKLVFIPNFDAIMKQNHYRLIQDTDSQLKAYLLETAPTS